MNYPNIRRRFRYAVLRRMLRQLILGPVRITVAEDERASVLPACFLTLATAWIRTSAQPSRTRPLGTRTRRPPPRDRRSSRSCICGEQ
jgi:hypothetical protein